MKKITTLRQLKILADQKKSVICPNFQAYAKPHPAAWMINLSGRQLYALINIGMYQYKKEKRT